MLKPWEPSVKGNSWISENRGNDWDSNSDDVDDEDEDDQSQGSGSDIEVVKEVTAEDRVIDNIGKCQFHFPRLVIDK